MKDPEFIGLRNRMLLGIAVCIILFTPFILFLFDKLSPDDPKMIREIKEEKTFYIYLYDNHTSSKYQKELKKEKVLYYQINKDRSRDYDKVLTRLDITENDIVLPSLIYIREGQLVATLNNIKTEEEIKTFIENYQGGE